jgi:hypothetical protein
VLVEAAAGEAVAGRVPKAGSAATAAVAAVAAVAAAVNIST